MNNYPQTAKVGIVGSDGFDCLARSNVAAALAQKVADRSFSFHRATEIARWVFVDNPMQIFNLAERHQRDDVGGSFLLPEDCSDPT